MIRNKGLVRPIRFLISFDKLAAQADLTTKCLIDYLSCFLSCFVVKTNCFVK